MKKTILVAAGIAVLAAGCAHEPVPSQLTDARAAYARAATSPGVKGVSADLDEAQRALTEAEKSYGDDGGSERTKSLAYVAHRRAIAVEAKGAAVKALEDKRIAEADFARYKAVASRQQLDRTKGALAEAESQRQARVAADSKMQELLSQIADLKTAQTERGLVLTLAGGILFASGKSTLLPTARTKLAEVARILKDDKRNMVVVGHTDSTGSDELNMRLSKARADAVRNYLVSQGMKDSRIRADGMGETQPLADNTLPEGRAINRRVEMVLEYAPADSQNTPPRIAPQK